MSAAHGTNRAARRLRALSVGERRGRREAAEFPLNQVGEGQRGAVLQIRSDDLHADRQAPRG
jgi:hypothetical protein